MFDILKDNEGNVLKCECGGVFKWTGAVLTSYPPQYPYHCDKCGKTKVKTTDGRIYSW